MIATAKNTTLRRYRKSAGLTQEELADAAQLCSKTVLRLEAGKGDVRGSTARKLTAALNSALGRSRERDNWIELTDIFPLEGE